jgi:phage terminase large subunit
MKRPEVSGTKILEALLANIRPIAVLEGSSRSSKTYSILQYLILQALQRPGLVVRSFRDDQTTCRKTVAADFQKIVLDQFPWLWLQGSWNKTDALFTYPNGSVHSFEGCDPAKLHGMAQDIAHLNEVMEIGYESWAQIAARTRGLKILDYNPSATRHWVFDTVLTRTGEVFYHHSTFRDNPFLTSVQVAEILAWEPTPENIARGTANRWQWDVYGLGKRGRREGTIITNWEITDAFPERWVCSRWGFGLDFGFSADPSALIECAIFQDALYLSEWVYETGLVSNISQSNPSLPSLELRFRETELDKNAKVYADSARPDLIAGLSASGYNVIPTVKNKDSILDGLQRLQGIKIFVHRASQNIQRELENYTWRKERSTGKQLDEPIDEWNHALDAVRYWALAELEPKGSGPAGRQLEADSDYRYT